QVNTGPDIQGSATLNTYVQGVVEEALSRFGEHVTRVEVHISDLNSHKGGAQDKSCAIEVRLAGLKPMAVTHQDENTELAIGGAVKKLKTAIKRTLGKLNAR